MARKPKQQGEYRFEIDAFTPDTIPLSRLSQYLSDIARMMGESANVHLVRIDKGSTVPVIRVDWESEPKVRERLQAVTFNEGPLEARRAFREINRRLVEDNANGTLFDPSLSKVIRFQGRDAASQMEFGPIMEAGAFQGVLIKIGGESDPVPVHLVDGEEKHIVKAPRRIAKVLASHLFSSVIRVEGKGRWLRNRLGEWECLDFYVSAFEVLKSGTFSEDLSALRAIPADWKQHEDPLGELAAIRGGARV